MDHQWNNEGVCVHCHVRALPHVAFCACPGVPQWVKDREREDAIMGGPPPSGASAGDLIGVTLGLAIRLGIWVLVAVVLYLVGRAVVG